MACEQAVFEDEIDAVGVAPALIGRRVVVAAVDVGGRAESQSGLKFRHAYVDTRIDDFLPDGVGDLRIVESGIGEAEKRWKLSGSPPRACGCRHEYGMPLPLFVGENNFKRVDLVAGQNIGYRYLNKLPASGGVAVEI